MKQKFTILTTALVLLAFLAIPLGMRGQSDYSTDYSGNITLSTEGGSNASDCQVIISNTPYDGIKAGTSGKTGAVMITVPSGTKYLHIHAAAWNNTTASLAVTPEGYSDEIALTANTGIANSSPFTFNGDPSTSDYYKVVTFENALSADTELTFTAVGGKRFVIWGVTSEASGATPTVAKPTINPGGGSFLTSQEVSISCTTEGATIYYTLNGNDPTTSSTQYTAPFTLTATTTVKAFAVKTGYNPSGIAIAEFTKVSAMSVDEAIDALDESSPIEGAVVSGIVSQVDEVSTQHGNATYWISDDGTTTSQLEVYRGKYLNNTNFTATDQIQVGDEVVVYGTLTLYQGTTYEFSQGNYLLSLVRPEPAVAAPTFSPEGGTYTEVQTVTITCTTAGATIYYTTDGTNPTNGSTLYSAPITVNETMTLKAIAYNSEGQASAVATAAYTIQLPTPTQTFSMIDGHNVIEGQTYLIVDLNSSKALTSANGTTVAPTAVEVTITNDQIITNNADLLWTFEAAEDGYIIHPAGDNDKWLYSTDANNGVRVGTNEANTWTLDITDEANPNYHGFMHNGTSRYLGVYNNQDWRAYTSINNNIKDTQIALFVLGDTPSPSITISNNEEIAYNATSGSFNFTINNPVSGGTTTVAENVDWISNAAISGTTVNFTATVNNGAAAREGVITLTYTYNRATVTKNVIVTQAGNPNVTMTIAQVRAQGTGNVATSGTVTSFSTNNSGKVTAYIQDATAAIVVFGEFTVAVGDNINVSGTLSDYNGLLEIINPEVAVISSGNTINPTLMTIAEILESTNQGWLIRIEGATVTAISGQNTTIEQGGSSIVVRGISSEVEYALNDLLTLNGNIGYYNGNQIAHPTDVTVQQSTTPFITIEQDIIELDNEETDDEIIVTYHNFTNINAQVQFYAADGETTATYNWITAEINSDNNVYYTIEANEGEVRTAYLKVNVGNVYSNLVTITQTGPNYATLPFEFDGGRADIAITNGLTSEGLSTDYGSSPKLKFNDTGDWVILHFEEVPGTLTFDTKGNGSGSDPWAGTFTLQTSADGETYTDLATYTELTSTVQSEEFDLDANVRYVKWIYTEKVLGNVALGNITLSKPSAMSQTIALAAGWTWCSFNVEITLDDLKAALVAALPNTAISIKGKDAYTNCVNGRWRGTLNALDVTQMYMIKTTADCEITLTGMPIDPTEHPITINASAVTWFAYPLTETMTVNNAFAGFAVSGDQVKDKNTYTNYTGRWRGTLSNLVPNVGYMYKSAATTPRTLVFPTSK